MRIVAIQTDVVDSRISIVDFLLKHVPKLKEKDIVVVTSKIVSVAEGRTVAPYDARVRATLIQKHADVVLSSEHPPLTYTNGMYSASSGIDESNGNGALVLPPRNPWKTAHELRSALQKKYKVRACGVLIVDSMPLPGRKGVVSCAIAVAGIVPVYDYKGKKDIFKRAFTYSSANHADALAAAAGAVMGEGDECRPLALISDAPVVFTSKKIRSQDIAVSIDTDIYKPLSKAVRAVRKKSIR